MGSSDKKFIERIFKNLAERNHIYNVVLKVESGDGYFSWKGAFGEMKTDSYYFLSEVTRLYVTAILMRLEVEKIIRFKDNLSLYLSEETIQNLHQISNRKDNSSEITIWHLMSNTSGLPDISYGYSLVNEINESRLWESGLGKIKKLLFKSTSDEGSKILFFDTNYSLLGRIIEKVTGNSFVEVVDAYIFKPLELRNSYFLIDENDNNPVSIYFKSRKLWLTKYFNSVPAEGGIISTVSDCMKFLKAFYNSTLFPKENLEKLKQWNLIHQTGGYVYYGAGIQKIYTSKVSNLFIPTSEIIGFRGITGSFAWYNPDTDLYFCGTTNQISSTGHAAINEAIKKMIKAAF